jgi:hypothetical protein
LTIDSRSSAWYIEIEKSLGASLYPEPQVSVEGKVTMTEIPRTYIVDEQQNRIAVQIEIATFEKIEEILENFALVGLMKQTEHEEVLGVAEAKTFYNSLSKSS